MASNAAPAPPPEPPTEVPTSKPATPPPPRLDAPTAADGSEAKKVGADEHGGMVVGGVDIGGLADERPEIVVGAAFAGGFLAALILKRLGR